MEKMSRMQSIAEDERGFSIIEVLIAIGLFSIGSLGVAALYFSTAVGLRSSNEKTEALFIAEDYMNRIVAIPYAQMAAGGADGPAVVVPAMQGKYTLTSLVDYNPLGSPPNTAKITVTVREQGRMQFQYEYLRALTPTSSI